jgi:8-oxo-dGTP diphosphatase
MGPPTEAGHTAIWAPSEMALTLITNEGDRAMLARALGQAGPR